jgi:hypothetical protein
MNSIRNSKKGRLWIIGVLIAVTIAALYFIKGTWAKVVLGAVLALLLTAFGMEATNNDYDVKKLAETKSFAASKMRQWKSIISVRLPVKIWMPSVLIVTMMVKCVKVYLSNSFTKNGVLFFCNSVVYY